MSTEKILVKRHRGRPPIFGPNEPRPLWRVHLSMNERVWKALASYMHDMDEASLSAAARRIISDKLSEMKYLKRDQGSD